MSLYNLLKTASPSFKFLDNRLYILSKEMRYRPIKQKLPEYISDIDDLKKYVSSKPIPICIMFHESYYY
jgi:hypothetical protein